MPIAEPDPRPTAWLLTLDRELTAVGARPSAWLSGRGVVFSGRAPSTTPCSFRTGTVLRGAPLACAGAAVALGAEPCPAEPLPAGGADELRPT